MAINPTVKQFGLSQGSGVLGSITDGDIGTGWAPLADTLDTYTAPFLDSVGQPNSAFSFPGFEFDFGTPVRMSTFLFQTETDSTLARGMLVASNNPALGVATMVQPGDQLLGIYTAEQLNGGHILETRAKDDDIQGRYVRLVFRAAGKDAPPDTSDPGFVDPSSAKQFDNAGPFALIVPAYTGKFTIEGWGGGASGGTSSTGVNGGQTAIPQYSLIANGGSKSALSSPNQNSSTANGGTASGGNVANVTGGAGGVPIPATTGQGTTGPGGDAPAGGGAGGLPVFVFIVTDSMFGPMLRFGLPGKAPGGGGSGKGQFVPLGELLAYKNPGGAAGGYFKHELTRGVDGPEPGDVITGTVGAGGVNTNYDGPGANGRVKFSFSA